VTHTQAALEHMQRALQYAANPNIVRWQIRDAVTHLEGFDCVSGLSTEVHGIATNADA
jgi:hypothetical protein